MTRSNSERIFSTAQKLIPGGVNSPVRAFRSVGGSPPFIARGEGSQIFDVDGNQYIDYVGSWGPLLLGHRHPVILEALREALESESQLFLRYRVLASASECTGSERSASGRASPETIESTSLAS